MVAFLEADERGRLKLTAVYELPPTDNKIYVNLRQGGRILSGQAKKYKSKVKEKTARSAITSKLSFRPNIAYRAEIVLYTDIYTKGWPKHAKWKFRRMDTTNRTKLLLDAVTEAVGIDDCHITEVLVRKENDPSEPRVEFTLEELWERPLPSATPE